MRLTVLGACGAWPEPGQACSGFLVEHGGFRLLVDALPAALDAVLALDGPGGLADAYTLNELIPGQRFDIGPFVASTVLLPHWVPNAGLRLAAGGTVLAYTGDSGPDPALVDLARDADLLLAARRPRPATTARSPSPPPACPST